MKLFKGHSSMLHSGREWVVCSYPGCDKTYLDPSQMRRHVKTHDPDNHFKPQVYARRVECDECKKSFSSHYIKAHLATHDGESLPLSKLHLLNLQASNTYTGSASLKHVCTCGLSFITPSKLKRHKSSHPLCDVLPSGAAGYDVGDDE